MTASASKFDYYQTVAGAFEDFRYIGKSDSTGLTISYLLYRDSTRKTEVSANLWRRSSRNFIDDVEIKVQRRRMAGWEAHLNHTEYFGNMTLQMNLGFKQGTGIFNALPAPEELFNEGTSRPKIYLAEVNLSIPFMMGKQSFRYNSTLRGQLNKTPLIQQDKFSIGGRYTVRGFDGELTLSGNRGYL